MPTQVVDNFNIVCSTLGGFIALFGLVSYLCKERFYLSETLLSMVAGAIFSPKAANLIRPLQYALDDQTTLNLITLYFSRLVLGIQLVIAGVQLPSKYLRTEWRSLAFLLGPGMVSMWIATSLLVWGLVPHLGIVAALAVGACVTPTDPVLANNIVKGKFADKNIPVALQNIIVAESGANDGLGYPFLFLPLFLMRYVQGPGDHSGGGGTAVQKWVVETLVYQIVLGAAYGAVVGWVAKELLHWAERKKYVDRESFLVFAIALALFIIGTGGLIGTDDVLACFIAGNTFTWDDWFRMETKDDTLQPTIDLLLNVSFFIWIGAVAPWDAFANNEVIPLYRLVFLGILVLLFRRLPFIFAMHKRISQITEWRQAVFVGFFGPIGVSAVFYLYIAVDFLEKNFTYEGELRQDAHQLIEVLTVVVWFLVICSVLVHGLTIPVGKLGLYLPRTLSRAVSANKTDASFNSNPLVPLDNTGATTPNLPFPRPTWRIGGSIIPSRNKEPPSSAPPTFPRGSRSTSPSQDQTNSPNQVSEKRDTFLKDSAGGQVQSNESLAVRSPLSRAIRFPDEATSSGEPVSTRSSFHGERDRSDRILDGDSGVRHVEEV